MRGCVFVLSCVLAIDTDCTVDFGCTVPVHCVCDSFATTQTRQFGIDPRAKINSSDLSIVGCEPQDEDCACLCRFRRVDVASKFVCTN
jgi:hypothetical protein